MKTPSMALSSTSTRTKYHFARSRMLRDARMVMKHSSVASKTIGSEKPSRPSA